MINKAILVGRLGKDPEVRYSTNGQMFVNMTLATDESYKDKSGSKVDKTEWHRIVVFGKLAEICANYLVKGSLIYLEGKLQTREWDKEGEKRYTTEIVMNEMKMLGGKGEKQTKSEPMPDDDVPF